MRTETCRICHENELRVVLDYGNVALADSFLDSEQDIEDEKKYPLRLCLCRNCRHIQIDEIIDPALLFENYVWETGISKSIRTFSEELYHNVATRYHAIPSENVPNVLEIASNDGSILSVFQKRHWDILGIDPARNIVAKANAQGIRSIAAFFNVATANMVAEQYGKWVVCIARNVLAHVNDLHGLVKGIQVILDKNGFGVIEVPHLKTMFVEGQYDQVFHEHLGYHSLESIQRLFGMYGMEVFDVEELWIHGGSIRVYVQHAHGPRKITDLVSQLVDQERELGLYTESAWDEFARKAVAHKHALRRELEALKARKKKVVIYGASGKGQSLLQFGAIDRTLIEYVIDKSEMKQGKLTPGTHLKIFSPSHIYQALPDVILLCAWNFAQEIMAQEARFAASGGVFLHPFPEPHYL